MTTKDRAALLSDAGTFLPDNGVGAVSVADVRQRIVDLADSARLAEDLGGAATLNVGTAAGTVAAGDDSRFPTAGTNDRILAWVSGAYSWVQAATAMIADSAITFAKMASGAIATTAELWTGAASKIVTASIVKDAAAYQTLTDATTIAWDMALGNRAQVTLGNNRTGGNPTNGIPNFGFTLKLTATGATRTWTPGNQFFPATSVESFPISVTTSETVYVVGFVDTATRFVITGVIRT